MRDSEGGGTYGTQIHFHTRLGKQRRQFVRSFAGISIGRGCSWGLRCVEERPYSEK